MTAWWGVSLVYLALVSFSLVSFSLVSFSLVSFSLVLAYNSLQIIHEDFSSL